MFVGVRFLTESSTASESNGFITFAIELVGASDSPVTVQVFSEETTPTQAQGLLVSITIHAFMLLIGEGVDYSDIALNITFAIGEKLTMMNVPIMNDCLTEESENFYVMLKNASDIMMLPPLLCVGIITDTSKLYPHKKWCRFKKPGRKEVVKSKVATKKWLR